MRRVIHSLVLLGLFAALVFHCSFALAAQQDLSSTPIKVVVVSGSNYEMGVQYGEMAAALIAENRDAAWELLDNLKDTGDPKDPSDDKLLGHDTILKDIEVWTYYLEKFDPKLKDWLFGISDGCMNKGVKVSYVDLVALMILPQELWARPSGPYPDETAVAFIPGKSPTHFAKARSDTRAMASCSAFAATGSATGGTPMLSLTLGYISQIQQYVILFAYPTEGESFVNLTPAGKVVNNTGMNRNFGWVMTAAVNYPGPCASAWGVTSEIYHHYLQQYCKTPAEAMQYLDKTPSGGVTGIFLFADKSGDVFAYEVNSCQSAVRSPGDLNETDFVVSTNNYNGPKMKDYAIPAAWFPDTYIRYATVYKKVAKEARLGAIGFEFTKSLWESNDWYDEVNKKWHTVPVPNDPNDLNTCNVPGNNCEGGESQTIAFPVQDSIYLQAGGPHGTSIQYYWPENPKPTGEYTKWTLLKSIDETAKAASNDALNMFNSASNALDHQAGLTWQERKALRDWLNTAWDAWARAERTASGNKGQRDMVAWSSAFTDYATAQLYSQMVSTKMRSQSAD